MKIDHYHPHCFIPSETNPEKDFFTVVSRINEITDKQFNLLPDEEIKSNRFHRDEDRLAYKIRHHLLNSWLSHFCRIPISALSFRLNADKKPATNSAGFYFNISRSGNVCAFIFGPKEVGIDIEMIRKMDDFKEVANMHFHSEEKKALHQNTDPDLFLKIWTRKEAYLKAVGSGLTDSLNSINCLNDTIIDGESTFQLHTYHGGDFIMSIALPGRINAGIQRFVY